MQSKMVAKYCNLHTELNAAYGIAASDIKGYTVVWSRHVQNMHDSNDLAMQMSPHLAHKFNIRPLGNTTLWLTRRALKQLGYQSSTFTAQSQDRIIDDQDLKTFNRVDSDQLHPGGRYYPEQSPPLERATMSGGLPAEMFGHEDPTYLGRLQRNPYEPDHEQSSYASVYQPPSVQDASGGSA